MSDSEEGVTQEGPSKENDGSRTRKDTVAVALDYDPESEFAPKVVAGGRGSVAEQILQIAFAQGVKVRKDADLAEMLSAIDIDSEIPIEAFAAVAEILTYVYRANGNMPDFVYEDMKAREEADQDTNSPDDKENKDTTP
ncbi:MAG: EscU/YscU/HrcU family type III secretion system export apparatus switch protein [Rhodospirillales bacterium]|nr:EscU/YscU/HrcU family type III secretion system export apparatus switch protein [Rhodospirillales bacterium]